MKSIIIIPARYASTRFPGKPLAEIGGIPMIVRVARRVRNCADRVVVATDDERIASVCHEYDIPSVMTRDDHKSGTDRIEEAYRKMVTDDTEYDVVVNVQGDEPFIDPEHIKLLISFFEDKNVDIATLCKPFPKDNPDERLDDPNRVKVVLADDSSALYFSRSVIPCLRGIPFNQWPERHQYLIHIGIYAYRPDILSRITEMPQSSLEICESLEQLRWLQNGLNIKVGMAHHSSIGIDTPEDLELVNSTLATGLETL